MKKQEAKIRATMQLSEAIRYLEDVVKSLKAKQVGITNRQQSLSLTPADTVKLEFEASQKPNKESVSFTVSWRTNGSLEEEADLKIQADRPPAGVTE